MKIESFIVINMLAFKVKKNGINISLFDCFTDIFLSMHVELITYPIHMQMSSKYIVLHCTCKIMQTRLTLTSNTFLSKSNKILM